LSLVHGCLGICLLLVSLLSHAESVRVRLHKAAPAARIVGQNLGVNGLDLKSTELFAHASDRELRLNQLQGPHKGHVMRARVFMVTGQALEINGYEAPSPAYIYYRGNMKVDVISHVQMERYIQGVLASEMPQSWPLEALKAQAVATRSYVKYQMRRRARLNFDVDDSVMDQVFKISRKVKGSVIQAVRETQGMVLTNEKAQSIKAYFHSNCGGHTTDAQSVWNSVSRFHGVLDPYCKGAPNSTWQKVITDQALLNALKIEGHIEDVRLKNKDSRVTQVDLVGDFGSYSVSGDKLRAKLGYDKLKSTFFSVEIDEGKLIFKGKGHGHGVGLCQWGAKRMAQKGMRFDEILSHYYGLGKKVFLNRKHLVSSVSHSDSRKKN
jgi:stage II sporulation protein D